MATLQSTPGATETDWPREVDLILSALEAASHGVEDRRQMPRTPYRRKGSLRLYVDAQGTPPWRIYTRDINHRGMGFITPHRLPLGYGGTVEIPGPDGGTLRVSCTLLRCREVSTGWFEGSLYFNRDQMEFLIEHPDSIDDGG